MANFTNKQLPNQFFYEVGLSIHVSLLMHNKDIYDRAFSWKSLNVVIAGSWASMVTADSCLILWENIVLENKAFLSFTCASETMKLLHITENF